MMRKLYPIVYNHRNEDMSKSDNFFSQNINLLFDLTQNDIEINPAFQCTLTEAISEISRLPDQKTPVDKMLVLKSTASAVREAVVRHVNTSQRSPKADKAMDDLSTDDLILLLIWVLLRAPSKVHECFPSDIRYVEIYHFVNSASTPIGFEFCHFQIVLNWITKKLEKVVGSHISYSLDS